MIRKTVEYFIPVQEDTSTEYSRRVRLVAYAIFLTMVFALFYVLVSAISGYYIGLMIMLASWFGYLVLMVLLKSGINVIKIANIFGFTGAASIYGSIYFSGGFESPVLPWLASTPIVLLLIAGKRSGFFWALVSVLIVLAFGLMDYYGFEFPKRYHASKETYFALSSQTGLVLIIFFISIVFENIRKRAFNQVNEQKNKLELTLSELKATQSQLIQSEKMASLGELTAGIAHEIQNPLNFVNNFSELNTELIEEAEQEIEKGNIPELMAILKDLKENELKVGHHGKRAESIVKGMLLHSRRNSGHKEQVDINALADEYLRLSYHGFRAKSSSFAAVFETKFDSSMPHINVNAQDIGRVLLNLINNAFYTVNSKASESSDSYIPVVTVGSLFFKEGSESKWVKIYVKDNGPGIHQSIINKIFQPFFTTKPAGQGTGLGLSLSYDIVKAHGGELKVETKVGEGATFIINLPVRD
jgi:signal transduction histidine kinase